jgi:ATP-binding cassette subfamily F protein uup
MEATIAEAEGELAACRARLEDPAIVSDAAEVAKRYAASEAARARVESLYARWAELDAKQS